MNDVCRTYTWHGQLEKVYKHQCQSKHDEELSYPPEPNYRWQLDFLDATREYRYLQSEREHRANARYIGKVAHDIAIGVCNGHERHKAEEGAR